MLFNKQNKAYFIVREGGARGRRFLVKPPKVTIGSSKKCDITLDGDYVSELHAVLEKKGSDWIVANNSPNGIYLNDKKVESEVLGNKSVLQIGSSNTLVFHDGETVDEVPDQSADAAGIAEKKTNWTLWGVGIAIIYLPAMYFVYQYMYSEGGVLATKSNRHTAKYLEKSVGDTKEYLLKLAEDNQPSVREKVDVDVSEVGVEDIFFLLPHAASANEREEMADTLLAQSKGHLIEGYWLFKSGRYSLAREQYNKAIALAPDPKTPTTKFALGGLGAIDKKTKKPKKKSRL